MKRFSDQILIRLLEARAPERHSQRSQLDLTLTQILRRINWDAITDDQIRRIEAGELPQQVLGPDPRAWPLLPPGATEAASVDPPAG